MKRADFIENSVSPYLALMVCDPKPGRKIQVCIDCQRVNFNPVKDVYHMHRIKDHLNFMTKATVF